MKNDFIGTVIDGKYTIQKHIGGGGMAQVYLATSDNDDTQVAVKIMNAELLRKTKAVDRFKREARLQCKLSHPNLVRGISSGDIEGTPYLVMEYIEGSMLSDLVSKRESLPPEEALKVLLDISLALNHLFMEGSIQAHRDIKPQNIMITSSGTAKLIDFGIAKAVDEEESLTLTSSFLGSPHYMSPEQITNPRTTDIRSDIYSLGAVFYELLTNEKAYEGESTKEIMDAHFELEHPMISGDGPLVEECNGIFAKTMAFEIKDRYQTPRNLIEDVRPLVDSSTEIRLPKFSRSSIRFAVAIASVLLATAIVIAVVIAYMPKANVNDQIGNPSETSTTAGGDYSGNNGSPERTKPELPEIPQGDIPSVTTNGGGLGGGGGTAADPTNGANQFSNEVRNSR